MQKILIRLIMLTMATAMTLSHAEAQEVIVENGQTYKIHKVVKAESLYRLSLDNNVSQEEILAANPELRKTGLTEGLTIKIPVRGGATVTRTHKVESGETAYSISQKYGMTLTDFLSLNPSATAGVRAGQEVTVRTHEDDNYTYTVKKGETAYSIATAHGMTTAQFLKLNPQCINGVREGDTVKVNKPTAYSGAYVFHVIEPKETLYSIGVKYGVKAQSILDANTAVNPDALPVGTAIRIPMSDIPEEDNNFWYHRIASGETLYSLCIRYDMLQELIKEYNESVDWNALRVGQIVAIPKQKEQVTTIYKEYTVERKETLYSISRDNNITVSELMAANPGVSTLKKGMTIKIPQTIKIARALPATADTTYVGNKTFSRGTGSSYNYFAEGCPTINVFLMLPFNANKEMTQLRMSDVNIATQSYNFKSHRYIEFYEGVKMALDSLTQAGANISLTVFDISNKLDAVNQLISSQVKPDIIIGPAHQNAMPGVLQYAAKNSVPVVLPFAQADSTILDNQFVFQASMIDTISGKNVEETIVRSINGEHVLIVSNKTKSHADQARIESFKKLCESRHVDYEVLDYNPREANDFMLKLREDKKNVILLATNSEARISSIVTSIAGVVDLKPGIDITLIGFDQWLQFTSIDVEVFHKLNTKIFSSYALDYSDAWTKRTLDKFRKQFNTEPVAFTPYFHKLGENSGFAEYGLWGYDVAMKFVGARLAFGKDMIRKINSYSPPLLQSNFIFRNTTNWGGAVNIGLKSITFKRDGSISISKATY